MKIPAKFLMMAVIVACAIPHGRAAILADYEFTGSSLASVDAHAQSVAGSFAKTSVYSANSFEDGSGNFLHVNGHQTPASEALAISTNAYLSFTVTAEAGYSLNLTSLTLGTAWYTTNAGSSGTTHFVVRSSIDNYAANLADYTHSSGQGNTTTPTFTARELDLTGVDFQSIAGITFRIYIWDGISAATRRSAVDGIILNGVAVSNVPEPSTYALLLGGVVMAVAGCRRTKRC